ncbi:hypothetical protein B0H67DRAFT_558225 [Lasiosphaeris hirsuta]|uniref:Uncharacterized protein n=1 Tax=Lasiosphaeris hirsuta TaxID=260670 RepID=A0AA40DJQ0_9PEZI|nr:hypothetical protein B0H67DRAFT_558225 [Lasiosphaeris hirsuta]
MDASQASWIALPVYEEFKHLLTAVYTDATRLSTEAGENDAQDIIEENLSRWVEADLDNWTTFSSLEPARKRGSDQEQNDDIWSKWFERVGDIVRRDDEWGLYRSNYYMYGAVKRCTLLPAKDFPELEALDDIVGFRDLIEDNNPHEPKQQLDASYTLAGYALSKLVSGYGEG